MDFVSYAWVIPALPLAAMILIFFGTRPLEMLARRRASGETAGAGHSAGHDHDASATDAHASPAVSAQGEDTHGASHSGGHSENGGATPFWAMAGSVIGVVAMVLAFFVAVGVLVEFLTTKDNNLIQHGQYIFLFDWFRFGNLDYTIAFRVDQLTAVMLVVVTGVSMLVHLYSIGYMEGDPGYSRFFIELALFTVAMLILVLGANFLVLFIGWELVGLSSYLLVGFWFDAAPEPPGSDLDLPYPPAAALKAFLTTRLGDFGFMIGILILFFSTGTFDFGALNSAATYTHVNQVALTAAMILVFCGAVGKSAQFPLHVWLPDAMAGPTPVSALIHAATMVAAGVYLVARLFPLYHFAAGPQSLEVVGYVGGFTALFAATIALVQNDIKKVLAYSTISQLGYMFVGLAVGPNNALGIFHLFTHAFFKALLFLGSGAVIHALGTQDMRKMGGLARYIPITAATFLVATLSISGFPFFAGFFSKDPIIGQAFDYGTTHGGNYTLYGLTIVTAFLTAFYMFRAYFLTFGGRYGQIAGFWGAERAYRGEAHPHPPSWVMWLPLVILAFPAALAGYWSSFANFLTKGATPAVNISDYINSAFSDKLTLIGIVVALAGIALAWLMYGVQALPAKVFTGNPIGKGIHALLMHKYYMDDLYRLIIKYVVLGLAHLTVLFDRYIIDGIVNGSGMAVRGLGAATRRTESGNTQGYGAAIFGGALIILLLLFFAVGVLKL